MFEKMLSSAQVIGIQKWEKSSLYEIEIMMPSLKPESWNTIRRLKCQVGLLEYRDYTPALWTENPNTCTLFIEANHQGTGSEWVKNLQIGEEILIGEAHAANVPIREGSILGLGDTTAIGHFLALKQLTNQITYPLKVGIFTNGQYDAPLDFMFDHPNFSFFPFTTEPSSTIACSLTALENWIEPIDLNSFSSVYIAGNNTLVKSLRSLIKTKINRDIKIYRHGFWS